MTLRRETIVPALAILVIAAATPLNRLSERRYGRIPRGPHHYTRRPEKFSGCSFHQSIAEQSQHRTDYRHQKAADIKTSDPAKTQLCAYETTNNNANNADGYRHEDCSRIFPRHE